MDKPDEIARAKEVRSLLDRIQQMPPNADGSASLQPPPNPYYQQWSSAHAAQLAALGPKRPPRRNGAVVNPWFFVLATGLNTIISAVLAVLITLSVVSQDSGREPGPPQVVAAPPEPPRASAIMIETPQITANRPVVLLPIGSPDRPLRLEASRPSPLPLRIQPDDAAADPFILVLSGLPAQARIEGAESIGSDSWLLAPHAAGNLRITLPEWSTSVLEIGVELRRTSGAVAARNRAWLAVPPPALPVRAPPTDQSVQELLQRGDQLLSRGDIVAARAVYERAAALGNAQAAFALGSTYDPSRLWSLGVFGMVGNKDRARQWYARAEQLGHPTARDRLRSLSE
jgi:hypothetical protein